MASLLRPVIIRYTLADGSTRTPDGRRVTKDTPGAVRKKHKATKWYGQYTDADGRERRVPLSANKTAAQQMLNALVRKAELGKVGVRDPFEEHARRPLREHLDDYRRYLEAEGNCREYVEKTYARILAILDGCRFTFIGDVAPEKVSEHLYGLRRDPPRPALPIGQEWFTPKELFAALGGQRPPHLARLLRRERLRTDGDGPKRRYPRATVEALQDRVCRGIGAVTSNGYLTAIKGFTRWLWEKERTDRDRLLSLARLNAKIDPRHERRALPEMELQAVLMAATQSAVVFKGLTGPQRMMLYAVAMVTGYRAGELASLVPASFDLDAEPPTATVKASYSKNRRTSVQPLPPDVARALRSFLDGKAANAAVWPGKWHEDAAEMLRIDLQAAGIPYRDEEGRVADFHALRHSYITLLERSGVSPKLAQELARHSDIRLTMNVYTHARLHDLAGAVEGLPSLLPAPPSGERNALPATGTDGGVAPCVAPKSDFRRDGLITIEMPTRREEGEAGESQPRKMKAFEIERNSLRWVEKEATRPGFEPGQREPKSVKEVFHLFLPTSVNVRSTGIFSRFLRFRRLASSGVVHPLSYRIATVKLQGWQPRD
jgi:integrase